MRTKQHYEKMLSENPNASIGFTIAADMVYAAVHGSCDVADHIDQNWRDIARSLKSKYGENLSVADVKNEMVKRPAASALGSIKSDKKSASSRENGKRGGRPKLINRYTVWASESGGGRLAYQDISTLVEARKLCRDELQAGKMRRIYDGEGIERYAPIDKNDDRRVWIEFDK